MKHEGKVVAVTGAGQGMGKAIAVQMAAEGAKVAGLDFNADTVAQTASEIGGAAIGVGCDVSDSASVAKALDQAVDTFGRLDYVVSCAGTGGLDAFLETPDESWHRVIGVNLNGTFFVCREGAKRIKQTAGSGGIINFSSTAFVSGEGPCHYVASKAGIVGLMRCIAGELAPQGIRVNNIVPGATDTPMMAGIPDEWREQMIQGIPLGRMGEPEEVAKVASFLLSSDASYITGQNIAVNGGMGFI